jgi:hypothetical protein
MTGKVTFGIFAVLLTCGAAGPAIAQDAAESAQIQAGVVQSQAGAGRSLGSAISRSMNAAGNAIGATGAVRASSRAGRHRQARARAEYSGTGAIPANVDPLARTDAATYRLGNRAVIRVSGGLMTTEPTSCIANCPQP